MKHILFLSFILCVFAIGYTSDQVWRIPASGGSTLPAWGPVNLAGGSAVTGILPQVNLPTSPTFSGTVTAQSGNASSPSFNVGNAGIYSNGSNGFGFSSNGSNSGFCDSSGTWTIGASGGTQSHALNGYLQLNPGSGSFAELFMSSASKALYLVPDTGSGQGGQVRLYGSSHATKPNYVEFTRGNSVSGYFDGSGNLTVGTVSLSGVSGNLPVTGAVLATVPFTGDSGAGGSTGVVPHPNPGDAAGGKFLKADGTWQVPSSTSLQRIYGTAQTSDGTLTSASYTDFTNQPTVSFTATRSAKFKIYGTFTVSNSTADSAYLTITASAGSPGTQFLQETKFDSTASNQYISMAPFLIATCTAGNSYTFKLQGKSASGTLTLRNSAFTGGHALIVEEM